MPEKTSPFVESKYGWNYGESGWNTGADENFIKFGFLHDSNIDGIVSTLPSPVNGTAYFNTTDNRVYFVVDLTYYSTPIPKWFELKIRSTGEVWYFNGTSLVAQEVIPQLTAAEIKTLYESNANTNAFTDQNLTDLTTLLENTGVFVTPEQYTGSFSAESLIQAVDSGSPVVIGASNTSVTLQDTLQVQKFMAAIDRITVLCSSFTVNIPSGQHTIAARSLVKSSNNSKIKINGVTPLETTLSSISSVTGVPGNWTVTSNLVSGAGISVGDMVLVRGVTPGVQQPGTYTTQPVRGAIQLGFFQMGEITTSGTTCTLSGSSADTYLASGDLIIVGGTVRRVLGTPTPSSFTIDIALPKEVSAQQYWYFMKSSGQGTVTISGTTVTGVGTLFTTSRIQAGDLIAVNRFGIRRVVSIQSDTQLTIDKDGMDVASASIWGAITPGELHEGAWVVSSINGNQVSWTHSGREPYAPPMHNINGGQVSILKSILNYGTNSGLVIDGGALEIDRVGLVGGNGTANSGIDTRGESNRPGSAVLGTKVGINGFDYAVRVGTGCSLYALSGHFSGQFTRGIDTAEGGQANLSSAIITGSAGIGVFIGTGCVVRLSDTRVLGNQLQGVRMEVGGNTWADFAIVGNNLGDNVLCVGGVLIHYVGMRCFSSGGSGISGQNGGYGRGSGALILSCAQAAQNWTHAQIETNQSINMGCLRGITCSRSRIAAETASFGYNKSVNYQLLNGGELEAQNSVCIGSALGISSTGVSKYIGINTGFAANTSDVSATERSLIYIKGKVGGTNFSPVLNTPSADGSLVTDI